MKKIMLIGSSGSGKSTLAKELGNILELPVHYLDEIYWNPGWIPTPNDEWKEIQQELVKNEEWIIDGNDSLTIDIHISNADIIIFFDLPKWLRIYRVIKRRINYHGKIRPDLGEGCPARLDFNDLKKVWNYDRDKKPDICQKLKRVTNKKIIIIIKKQAEANKLIEQFKTNEIIVGNFKKNEHIQ